MNDLAAPDDASGSPLPRRQGTWLYGTGFAAVLLLTIWPRLASIPLLFAQGELMQWDGDSAYHLKRILYALTHSLDLPRVDPSMNWPAGAPCPWPDGFDVIAAAWGLVAGLGVPARAANAVLIFTLILALLVVWAAVDLARLVIGDGPAKPGAVLAAGALTALVPSAIFQSQVGFLDHHIAELLAFLLLAGWSLRRLPRPEGPTVEAGMAWEIGGMLASTFALWVFAGGVLYVAIAAVIVAVALLREERPAIAGSGFPALVTSALAVAALTLPTLNAHGRLFTYQFPSLVQPLLVGVAATGLGLTLLATRFVRGFLQRAGVLAALFLGLGALALLIFPQAAHEVRAGLEGWLLRKDPWIATVAEFQPFGFDQRSFLLALFTTFGAIGVGAPLILVAGGWATIRASGVRGVAFVLLSAGFVFLSLRQNRFERIGQPLLMINMTAALAAFAHRRRSSPNLAAAAVFPVLATAVLVVSDPMLRRSFRPPWTRIPVHAAAALDLRYETGGQRDLGVLTAWDQGHLVSFLSGQPTPTNGFGSYLDPETFRESQQVFTTDGSTIDGYLTRHRTHFILAGAMSDNLLQVNGRNPFAPTVERKGGVLDLEYMRSFGSSPLVIGGSAIPGANVKHLGMLMPVFATREQPGGLAFALPALWLYERVAGARLLGKAPPGKRVVASLDFHEQGRAHVWRAYADAGPGGDYELVIPFPTALVRPTLASGARYALRVDDGPPTEVAVPERAVREGAVIRVAPLRPGTGAQLAEKGSRSVKTAPPASPLATEITPPKDSAIP